MASPRNHVGPRGSNRIAPPTPSIEIILRLVQADRLQLLPNIGVYIIEALRLALRLQMILGAFSIPIDYLGS